MLYESNYNQYFLEHSWGPWKNHMYISREGESGHFVYKYPKEYYDKYRQRLMTEAAKRGDRESYNKYANLNNTTIDKYHQSTFNKFAGRLEGEGSTIDEVINRSVKAAVKALNFGVDLKQKAEGYLNRFGNAVANAWGSVKTSAKQYISAGKQFASNTWNKAVNNITVQRVSASVQNLIKGAGEAVSKGWNRAKETVSTAATTIGGRIKKKRAMSAGKQRVSKGDEEVAEKSSHHRTH